MLQEGELCFKYIVGFVLQYSFLCYSFTPFFPELRLGLVRDISERLPAR